MKPEIKMFLLTNAILLAIIIVMMNDSKYLCSTKTKALHLKAHHFFPIFVFSTRIQHGHFLLIILQKQSSGSVEKTASTSFISGSPVASTFFILILESSSSDVELLELLSSECLLLLMDEALLADLVEVCWNKQIKDI